MAPAEFNAILLDISDQLSQEQLERILFLCKGTITKKDTESIKTGLKLFTILMERQKLAEDNTDFLCEILEKVHRPDLVAKLQPFAEQCHNDNSK